MAVIAKGSLVFAVAAALMLASCGGQSAETDTNSAGSVSQKPPPAFLKPPVLQNPPVPQKPVAEQKDLPLVAEACGYTQRALAALKDSTVVIVDKSQTVAETLGYAFSALAQVNVIASLDLARFNNEIAQMRLQLLKTPSRTPDLAPLRKSYDTVCVQSLGSDPV